jgi:hypothetical protein
MEDLSLILWRERELLELLLFKLEEEQLVLASGRTRWLAMAAHEVENVLVSIREAELLRATAADSAAASIGLEPNPSLRALAEGVDEPWQSILLDHREAFLAYTTQIMEMASSNRDLLTAGYQAARDTLIALGDGPSGYAPDGSVVVDSQRRRLVDRSI